MRKKKTAELNENVITNNGIRTHPQETIPLAEAPTQLPAEPPPRVLTPTPRVNAPSPRVEIEPQLVVACPTDANFVNSEKRPNYPMPNYISQDKVEAPAHNTRAQRSNPLSITQETILSCIEMLTTKQVQETSPADISHSKCCVK